MDPEITSRGVVPQFDVQLNPIMERAKLKAESKNVAWSSHTENRRSGSLTLKSEEQVKKDGHFSLFPAMIKTFGPTFFVGSAMKIINGKI